jgi:hypothetical protein
MRSMLDCYAQLLSMTGHPLAAILCALVIWRLVRTGEISYNRFTPWTRCAYGKLRPRLTAASCCRFSAGDIGDQPDHRKISDASGNEICHPAGVARLSKLAGWCRRRPADGGPAVRILGTHIRWEYLRIMSQADRVQAPYRAAAQQPRELRIVINDGDRFFRLVHYTPAAFSSRLVYLVDPDAAKKI